MDWMEMTTPGLTGRRCRSLSICFLIISVLSSMGLTYADGTNDTVNDAWSGFSSGCTAADARNASVSCYGIRIVRKIMQQILDKSVKEPNIEIVEGVNLVELPGAESTRKGKALKGFGTVGPLLQFLEGRELRIKLPNLLPQNIESAIQEGLSVGQGRGGGGGGYGGGGGGGGFGGGGGGGKGGKKGGGGGYMILALMMGKMMAAMGFGALGLLAMKALMVSAMALMLSIIIAVKKLASGGDQGGGHHVVYAQEVSGHHHKKRSLGDDSYHQLPYRGYVKLFGDSRVS